MNWINKTDMLSLGLIVLNAALGMGHYIYGQPAEAAYFMAVACLITVCVRP